MEHILKHWRQPPAPPPPPLPPRPYRDDQPHRDLPPLPDGMSRAEIICLSVVGVGIGILLFLAIINPIGF